MDEAVLRSAESCFSKQFAAAEFKLQIAGRVEHFDAVVAAVSDPNSIVLIHIDPPGPPELAGARAVGAE